MREDAWNQNGVNRQRRITYSEEASAKVKRSLKKPPYIRLLGQTPRVSPSVRHKQRNNANSTVSAQPINAT